MNCYSGTDIEKNCSRELTTTSASRYGKERPKKLSNFTEAVIFIAASLLVVPCLVSADVSISPNKNLIDLSWPYNEKTIAWIDFRNFSMDIIVDGERKTSDGESIWVRAENIALAIHSGTHMDAPLHFGKDKWSVDEIPVEHLVDRPLIIINAEHSVIKNRDYQITEADLLAWEEENGRIPEGAVIFLRTGMSKHYSDRRRYLGAGSGVISKTNLHFPGLHGEAAEWIVRNRLIAGIGIDALSLDSGQSKGLHCHVTVLNRNIYILENLNDKIDQIPVTGAKVHVFPMKIEGASGAPVRVVVDINYGSRLKPLITLITFCISAFAYNVL